uniref:Uncharacterized protein n=1 Tax=Aegilops tauschii subsp. strangulata TaxID=200361 RepID=A0A453PD76_AEGTS
METEAHLCVKLYSCIASVPNHKQSANSSLPSYTKGSDYSKSIYNKFSLPCSE